MILYMYKVFLDRTTFEECLIRELFALVEWCRVAAVVDLLVLLKQIGEVQACIYYTHVSSWKASH